MTQRAAIVALVAGLAAVAISTGCAGDDERTAVGRLPPSHHVHALRAADDGTLLLGLHGALWRSNDAGLTWEEAGLEGEDAMAIGIDPGTDGPLLVAGHGLLARAPRPTAPFESLRPDELGSLDIHALAQAPSEPTTAYAFVVDAGLFITDDAGDSWTQVAPVGDEFGPDITGMAVDPADPDTLLMAGGRTGVVRSADGGRTFTRVVGAGAFSVAYVGDGSDQAVAVTQRGIETSQDGGRTWQVVT
ncbi:MAG: hypothetical protein M3N57_06085, partial [Actinomycetota bacterium]|nr:hypothetical protein [Actinomycetota bacterium]